LYERNLPSPFNQHMFELKEAVGRDRRAEALPQGVEALRAVQSPLGLSGTERGIYPERMLLQK
jgi:hypothetical protein